jgi:hypothetical protein
MGINREAVTANAVDRVVTMVASILNDDENPVWLEEFGRLSPAETQEFLAACAVHRIAEIVTTSRYFALLPPVIATTLDNRTRAAAAKVLKLAHDTREVYQMLTAAGIPCLVYKGVTLSVMTAAKINARGPGDVDVLVAPGDVLRAHNVLVAQGWISRFDITPGQRSAWRFFAWLFRELPYSRGTSHVDLHWRMSQETGLFASAQLLISRGQRCSIGGREVLTLSGSDALTAAAYHFFHDGCHSLRSLIDVYRLSKIVDTLPSDCAPALAQLTREVTAFARVLLAPQAPPHRGGLSPDAGVERVASLWGVNSRMVKRLTPTVGLSFREITTTSKLHLVSGNAFASACHFWLARMFDFDHGDLRRGPAVIAEAIVAKIKIQTSRRLRSRSR